MLEVAVGLVVLDVAVAVVAAAVVVELGRKVAGRHDIAGLGYR